MQHVQEFLALRDLDGIKATVDSHLITLGGSNSIINSLSDFASDCLILFSFPIAFCVRVCVCFFFVRVDFVRVDLYYIILPFCIFNAQTQTPRVTLFFSYRQRRASLSVALPPPAVPAGVNDPEPSRKPSLALSRSASFASASSPTPPAQLHRKGGKEGDRNKGGKGERFLFDLEP
jgi:hypothetical protein